MDHSQGIAGVGLFVHDLDAPPPVQESGYLVADFSA
jgi:hypothetical protein